MGSPTIFNGPAVKLLKSVMKFFNGTQIQSAAVDPSSVATAGEIGDLLLSTTTGYTYQKTDSGSSTNWSTLLTTNTTTSDISLASEDFIFLESNDGTDYAYCEIQTNYIYSEAFDDSSSATASTNLDTSNGIAKFTVTAESSYASKTNNNASGLTELVYGYTQQKFTGTAPSGSVKINKTKSGDVLYIRNSTASTINFIQNSTETFNGATNIDITTGKTASFVQFGGDGIFTVFIGP